MSWLCVLCPSSSLLVFLHSFQLQTVENLTEKTEQYVFVRATLYHGTDTLPKVESITTKKMPIKSIIDWNKKLEFNIQIKYLPRVRYLQLILVSCVLYVVGDVGNQFLVGGLFQCLKSIYLCIYLSICISIYLCICLPIGYKAHDCCEWRQARNGHQVILLGLDISVQPQVWHCTNVPCSVNWHQS